METTPRVSALGVAISTLRRGVDETTLGATLYSHIFNLTGRNIDQELFKLDRIARAGGDAWLSWGQYGTTRLRFKIGSFSGAAETDPLSNLSYLLIFML